MQYAIARDGMNDTKSPHGARAAARGIAAVILTLALITTTACSKSVSVTVDGESISFDEREQEAIVRLDHCQEGLPAGNRTLTCFFAAPREAQIEESERQAWLGKVSKYARSRATSALGTSQLEDAELRSKLLEICGRLFPAEAAWCAMNYGGTP